MEQLLILIVGLGVGVVIGLLIAKSQKQTLVTKVEVLQTQFDNAKTLLENEKTRAEKQIEAIKEESRLLIAEAKNEAVETQKSQFNETLAKITEQMKTATSDMLRQRQKEFTELSNANLGQIVNPLRETISKMETTMNNATIKQTEMSSILKENIENVMRQSMAAKQSADELARVFKHAGKVQGDWGETILDELLESQGLTCGIHYDVQAFIRDANGAIIKSSEGSTLRPDVILHLDQYREVIIDSKVSITSYIDYVNAETEPERQQFLKEHVESVEKHYKELSAKDYSSYIQQPKVKMDYVIMFVPHVGAFWAAMNAKPDLWRRAMEKNVFIADEQTLFAALRIVNLTWKQIAQAQNHKEVYDLANEMLDRVGIFMKKYQAIGKALKSAQDAYYEGEKKLQPSGQSILQTCAKLEKLGAKQSDKNPLPQISNLNDNALTE